MYIYISLYRVIQEEISILWESMVLVVVRREVNLTLYLYKYIQGDSGRNINTLGGDGIGIGK